MDQYDPMLAPLADNGGPTKTHALLPGSPAIDRSNNMGDVDTDQRGTGYPRLVGAAPDIGAFEAPAGMSSTSGALGPGAAHWHMAFDNAFRRYPANKAASPRGGAAQEFRS